MNLIGNQSISEGFKQTDVGVIPNDWEVKEISKAFEICNTLRFPLSAKVRESMTGEYPYYGPTKIQGYINEYRIDGEYALIGEDGDHFLKFETVPQTQLARGKFNVNNHAHVIKGKVASAEWFYLFFKHREITNHLSRQGAGRYKLNKATLEQLPCAIPSKEEQTAIANVLSDVDALLTELENLIAKKQAIKTATMQQLLTGKTRLPLFANHTEVAVEGKSKGTKPSELGEIPEDWEVGKLNDVCFSFKTGKLDANAMKKDGEYRFYTCAREHYYIDNYAFDTEALLVSGNGANVGYVHYFKGKFNAYQRTYVLSKFNADAKYLKIYLEEKLAERIRVEVNSGNMPYITMDTLTDMLIALPPKDEQTAIATILSDMDNEIQTLEQRLAKTRQIKQGMMQQLLTGRTRLPY